MVVLKRNLNDVVKSWLPLGVAIALLSILVCGLIKTDIRSAADENLIQSSEDIANELSNREEFTPGAPPTTVDMSKSLAPFLIFFDAKGKPVYSTVQLDKKTPTVPQGALDYAKKNKQNRLTWEPKDGVRNATVITYYHAVKNEGYVLVGKSLRETEARKDRVLALSVLGWFITSLASLATHFFITPVTKTSTRKK